MITLQLATPKKTPTIDDQLKSLPNVRSLGMPGGHPNLPTQHVVTFNALRAKDGRRVAADYFCEPEGSGWIDALGNTTISLAFLQLLEAEQLEALRKLLEDRINELVESKYSYFLQIVGEACEDLPAEYGVVGHSSYVPS